VVFFTGGTISMALDSAAGGNVPTLDGAAILRRTPGLEAIADVRAVDLGLTPASHFTLQRLLEIGRTIGEATADPTVDGVVVVQGTDTIEETALCWDLVQRDATPVVVTGAMRSSSEAGYDGPANLADAVRCAASPDLRGEGVVVVLGGTIHAADEVLKTHTSSLTTFQSPNLGPLGWIDGAGVVVLRRRAARRSVQAARAVEPIYLLTATVGMDGALLDAAVTAGARGIVVAATGAGNTTPELLAAGRRAMEAGIPVVLVSRAPAGRAGTGYAFPGGGSTWVTAGALLAGSLSGPKARIVLALGLGAGLDRQDLAALLADPAVAPVPHG